MTTTKTTKKPRRPFTAATYEQYSSEIINRARAVLNTVGNAASQKAKRPFKFRPIKGKPDAAHILDRFNKTVVRESGHTIELSLVAVKAKRKKRTKVRAKTKTARTKTRRRRVTKNTDADVVEQISSVLERAQRNAEVIAKIRALLAGASA